MPSGTDMSILNSMPAPDNIAPAIILVRPQLGENVGMCARAMLNCGVTELRIVSPRDGWPNPVAASAASGATMILDNARIFDTVADAIAGLDYVFATTARHRDIVKTVMDSQHAAQVMRRTNHGQETQKCGILFGPERTGLENDDVAFADAILNIPLNPGFSSLNLAQAVLLVCHAWLSADNHFAQSTDPIDVAPKDEIENLARHFEDTMEAGGFFRSPEQRPVIIRNLRNFLFRSGITSQETRVFHGIIKCLTRSNNP